MSRHPPASTYAFERAFVLTSHMRSGGDETLNVTKFHLTRHVQQRMLQRGLSVQDLKDVVKYAQNPFKQKQGTHGGTIYRFSKQRGRVTVTVVAEVKSQECWLITGWK